MSAGLFRSVPPGLSSYLYFPGIKKESFQMCMHAVRRTLVTLAFEEALTHDKDRLHQVDCILFGSPLNAHFDSISDIMT